MQRTLTSASLLSLTLSSPPLPQDFAPESFKQWKEAQAAQVSREHRGLSLLDYWESIISERHKDYQALKGERDSTAAQLYAAVQRRHVIEKASEFFLDGNFDEAVEGVGSPMAMRGGALVRDAEAGISMTARRGGAGPSAEEDEMSFKHIAGIVSTEDKARFSRIIYRASSGHAVVRFADIESPLIDEKGAKHDKSVFVIFYRGRALSGKLDRICTAFNANQHDIPSFNNHDAVTAALAETKTAIDDSVAWLEHEKVTSVTSLRHLSFLLRKWQTGIQREKGVYFTMNQFLRAPENRLTGQGWVLESAFQQVYQTLSDVHSNPALGTRAQPFFMEALPEEKSTPPTHFATNKFTRVFQGIVNTYGVPRYGEANPALWSIITFPFLFGVMYGDIGHASLLTIAAAYIVLKEKELGAGKQSEIFGMAFKGRYMLLLMGLFSIYCGFIYNDLFSIATTAFGSSKWHYGSVNGTLATIASKNHGLDDVYPFGVDPEWHAADNDLLFFNSLKMKMSVIFGIAQMTFGLILRTLNALHFKSKMDLWLECVPQLVFMICLFGYMVFLIFFKWCTDWSAPGAGAPPSLIDTLINVVLKPGTLNDPLYGGQAQVQVAILLIVFFCVPIMLLGKPLLLNKQMKKRAAERQEEKARLLAMDGTAAASANPLATLDGSVAQAPARSHGHGSHGAEEEHEHSFGDIFIHQAIETIEFVLGSVSNTASYLRLWALSLAHSQLASVFWERAMVSTVEMNSPVLVVVGYGVWAGISGIILMAMDVLECFLHALRLHWVEFQNKFYKADGHKFMPFSFAAIAEAADKD